jgi:hypothetical protein
LFCFAFAIGIGTAQKIERDYVAAFKRARKGNIRQKNRPGDSFGKTTMETAFEGLEGSDFQELALV